MRFHKVTKILAVRFRCPCGFPVKVLSGCAAQPFHFEATRLLNATCVMLFSRATSSSACTVRRCHRVVPPDPSAQGWAQRGIRIKRPLSAMNSMRLKLAPIHRARCRLARVKRSFRGSRSCKSCLSANKKPFRQTKSHSAYIATGQNRSCMC